MKAKLLRQLRKRYEIAYFAEDDEYIVYDRKKKEAELIKGNRTYRSPNELGPFRHGIWKMKGTAWLLLHILGSDRFEELLLRRSRRRAVRYEKELLHRLREKRI